jgi:hypothetical protein
MSIDFRRTLGRINRPGIISPYIGFIIAAGIAGAVGNAFGFAAQEPEKILTLSMFLIGGALISFVIYDGARRYQAKRELSKIFGSASEADLYWLWLSHIRVLDFSFYNPYEKEYKPLHEFLTRLTEFLNSSRYGDLARQALFQRSPAGRDRYFRNVVARSRAWRTFED